MEETKGMCLNIHIMNDTVSLINGVEIGQTGTREGLTGCTVALLKEGATVGIDIRGGAPGSYNFGCFLPTTQRETADAVFLSGGSFFGLDVAKGVRDFLVDIERGWDTGRGVMPCVTGAIIYDLQVAGEGIHPDADMGYEACSKACSDPVSEGNYGAGLGATCGKLLGMDLCMKGGVGSSVSVFSNGLQVGALTVVNCVGNVFDIKGDRIIAGTRRGDGTGFLDPYELFDSLGFLLPNTSFPDLNTTIGLVATNVKITKKEASKIAEMSHDGLARSIKPIHTLRDGDTIFAVGTGELSLPSGSALSLARGPKFPDEEDNLLSEFMDRSNFISYIGHLASEEIRKSVLRAVMNAESIEGIPSAQDYSFLKL
jgi:L-aminopeptidase/D-esterase-like protein